MDVTSEMRINAQRRLDNERIFTATDITPVSDAFQIVITPAADERVVIVGFHGHIEIGAGGANNLTITGAALLLETGKDFKNDAQPDVDTPVSGETEGQALTIDASATEITAGILTVSYKLQKPALA